MSADLDALHKTMVKLRDDARKRGPDLREVALFYAREAFRLSQERIRQILERRNS